MVVCYSKHVIVYLISVLGSLLQGAGIRAGGAFVAGGAVGPRLSALTAPTHTLTTTAAQQSQAGHTGVCTSRTIAVLPLPVWITLAKTTGTSAMTWNEP